MTTTPKRRRRSPETRAGSDSKGTLTALPRPASSVQRSLPRPRCWPGVRHSALRSASPTFAACARTHRRPRVGRRVCVVRIHLKMHAALGVDQFEFAGPWRFAIFGRPDVDQHQLVAKIGDVLQRLLGSCLIEEVGDDDDQSALRIVRWRTAAPPEGSCLPRSLRGRSGNALREESDGGRRRSYRTLPAMIENACRHTVSSRTRPT